MTSDELFEMRQQVRRAADAYDAIAQVVVSEYLTQALTFGVGWPSHVGIAESLCLYMHNGEVRQRAKHLCVLVWDVCLAKKKEGL